MEVLYDSSLRAYEFHWKGTFVVVPAKELREFLGQMKEFEEKLV